MPDSLSKYPRLLAYWMRRGAQSLTRRIARMGPAGYQDLLDNEARHWKEGDKGHTWLDSKTIQALINSRISGDEDIYWLLHFMRRHVPDGAGPGLVLGCGKGDLELNAISIGLCSEFHSFDLSGEAVGRCKRAVSEAGGEIETFCKDLNNVRFKADSYSLAFAANILHHLVEIEHLLDEVKRALKPKGLFVVHEYVGPRRFQWDDAQIREVNRILGGLPRKYRRNRRRRFGARNRLYRPPLDATSLDSPFEAARSDEILPLLEERFEVVERVDIGGALLHPLLEAIIGNFDDEDPADRELLENLWRREKELMAGGVLGSDFVYAVFRKAD